MIDDPDDLRDATPEELARHARGLCIECGQEPPVDGLFGARCAEAAHQKTRYRRRGPTVSEDLSKRPRRSWLSRLFRLLP
jgi:hypothetical protein